MKVPDTYKFPALQLPGVRGLPSPAPWGQAGPSTIEAAARAAAEGDASGYTSLPLQEGCLKTRCCLLGEAKKLLALKVKLLLQGS